MKSNKRVGRLVLAALLSVMLVTTMVPTVAFADDGPAGESATQEPAASAAGAEEIDASNIDGATSLPRVTLNSQTR